MKDSVYLVNMVNCPVSISLPDLKYKRDWPMRGAKIAMPKDVLEEALFDPGFKNIIDNGILYIEDMEVKKELGLEPEEAEEPQNIIVLTDKQIERLMAIAPAYDLKEILPKLHKEQIQNLVEYAINHEIIDKEKTSLLEGYTTVNILKAVEIRRQELAK